MGHLAAEAIHHLAHRVIGEAGAVVDIEDAEHPGAAETITQRVQRGQGRFRQVDGEADDAARGPVDDRRHFRAEGFAGATVDDFSVELVAVRHPRVVRPHAIRDAAVERLQRLSLARPHASHFAGLWRQLG
ncbi:hypothetical protein D9M69_615470 [compost metagenome]